MLIGVEDFELLLSDEFRELVEENIDRDPNDIALDKRLSHSALVATQVKYLQRAKRKLPSYYRARCIIPTRAYEQCSSESTAAAKGWGVSKGEANVVKDEVSGVNALSGSVLELTCGLGVDTIYLARQFERVVTLERDEQLAVVARENFKRLEISNIEVLNISAEEYISQTSERFDLIYVDPDRRTESGDRVVRLEECSPNIIDLKDLIVSHSRALMVKLSPLFDVDEALRIFAPARVEVVSSAGECKELIATTLHGFDPAVDATIEPTIAVNAVGLGYAEVKCCDLNNAPSVELFDPQIYTHLITPDVALQKSRTACHFLRDVAAIWSNNSYAFVQLNEPLPEEQQRKIERVIGRVERIQTIEEYNPKRLKKRLKELNIKGIEILKRDFPHSAQSIAKQLNVRQGGTQRIAFTSIQERLYTVILN